MFKITDRPRRIPRLTPDQPTDPREARVQTSVSPAHQTDTSGLEYGQSVAVRRYDLKGTLPISYVATPAALRQAMDHAAGERSREKAEADDRDMGMERDRDAFFALFEKRGPLLLKVWLGEAQRYRESLSVDGRR